MMRTHRWIVSGLVMSLVAWTSPALAATDAEAQEAIAPEALETMVRELQADGLSAVEAREIAEQATREVVGEREGAERPGGMPEGINRDPTSLTQQERALMNQVQTLEQDLQKQGLSQEQVHQQIESQMGDKLRDDAKLQELSERGVPGMERASGLEHRGSGQGERGQSESGSGSREQSSGERGSSEREHSTRETERTERPTAERTTMERESTTRETERPTMERESSTREMERPTMERPEMERPTSEHPAGTP